MLTEKQLLQKPDSNGIDYQEMVSEINADAAIQETLQNRGTAYEKDSFDRILALADDPDMQTKWRYFLKTLGNPDMPFTMVVDGIKAFLLPIWDAIVAEDALRKSWKSKKCIWTYSS